MDRRKKVLLIDDTVDLCVLMKVYYQRKNYEVHVAHTLSGGLIRAKEVQPDLILLSTELCSHPIQTIAQLKEAAPHAELITG